MKKKSKIFFALFLIFLITITTALVCSAGERHLIQKKKPKKPVVSTYDSSCFCPNGSVPTCAGSEKFSCVNGFPLCINKETSNAVTPSCIPVSSSGFVPDGCCRVCPNGEKPTCDQEDIDKGYSYWCVSGAPNCCKEVQSSSITCTDKKGPKCFYPDVTSIPTMNVALCNDDTERCPDGSEIKCREGYEFSCINGRPDCCKGDLCTDEFDPSCFYTKQCIGEPTKDINVKCCSICPDGKTVPSCSAPLSYWCVNGKKRCCILPAGGIAPDDLLCEENDLCPGDLAINKSLCGTLSKNHACCKPCEDGSSPTCEPGKILWCEDNRLTCCDGSGNFCESPGACNNTFKCPSGILPDVGCCKSCVNRIDNPTCPSGTSHWCSNGTPKCCKPNPLNPNSPLCLPYVKEKTLVCPANATRKCG